MRKQLVWKSEDGGQESLSLRNLGSTIEATSVVKGGDSDLHTSWDVTYSLVCDSNWRTRSFTADERKTGRHVELHRQENGRWEDGNQKEIPELAGCIDVDFRATPFSNTLPIRRLNLHVGESTAISVVYINAPELATTRERQIYTRLSDRIWRFEQPSAGFQATITVDDEGFVLDYPGLFYRVA